MTTALAWLKVAESDPLWGKDSLKAGHFPQACFIAQQVGEKAIKALEMAETLLKKISNMININ